MSKEKIKRNKDLFKDYSKGRLSKRAIAKKYNIAHPREIEIINKMKKQLSPKQTKRLLGIKNLIRGSKKY
jgi:hypothetical protein